MYSIKLKINRLSLAAEARIIKRECSRLKRRGKHNEIGPLHHHRVGAVRYASRVANLAHAFLVDTSYEATEKAKGNQLPLWIAKDVAAKVSKFGPATDVKQIEAWIEGKVLTPQ